MKKPTPKETTSETNSTTNGVRPFGDLIKKIEFEGKKFVPAVKIASLCFNYNEKTVKTKAKNKKHKNEYSNPQQPERTFF